jgi:hypothetical protein
MGIINWVRAGGWVRSGYAGLPLLRPDDSPQHQTWLILAGGLALVLSRSSKAEIASRFASSRDLFRHLQRKLPSRGTPKPTTALVERVLREIASVADPMTQAAGRECLRIVAERTGVKPQRVVMPHSMSPSTHGANGDSTVAPAHENDNAATQINLDLLFERSNQLRQTVAWARTTTFGQD